MIRMIVAFSLIATCQLAIAGNRFAAGSDLYQWYLGYKHIVSSQGDSVDLRNGNILTGYIMGVVDSSPDLCMADTAKSKQLVYIVGQYLDGHPEIWDQRGAILVHQVLLKTFPCG